MDIILDQGIEPASLSPYVTKGPVPATMFFGREKEIKLISQTIQNTDYAILGGRLIGKSSTLLAMKRLFARNPRYKPIYLNCEDKFDRESFYRAAGDEVGRPLAKPDAYHFRRLGPKSSCSSRRGRRAPVHRYTNRAWVSAVQDISVTCP